MNIARGRGLRICAPGNAGWHRRPPNRVEGPGPQDSNVGAVSADLGTVKAEMATKTDLGAVSADLAAVSAKVDRVSNDLDGVKAVMVTKEDLRREIAASEARMEQRMQSAILEAKVSLIKWMIATNLATMAVFSGIVIGAMSALQ